MKQKKIPMRKCTGCGEMKEKKQLVRVVKAPDIKDENGEIIQSGEISVDMTGKKSGRGAYVCNDPKCLAAAKKARRFEKAFSCRIPDDVYEKLAKELGAE
ncbi:MAG: YlxR family protein [Clostridia bacterium]|nr:YlxR family protein [Clostridia bacterium]